MLWILGTAIAADNALELDGADDYVEMGALDPGVPFTVEAWLNFSSAASSEYHTVFEAVDPATGQNEFLLAYFEDHWLVEIVDSNTTEGSSCVDAADALCYYTAVPATGVDLHVAVVVTSTDITLYLDGVQESVVTISNSPTWGDAVWVLGADTDDGTNFSSEELDGVMDDARVWNDELTQEQISCLMDYRLVGDEAGLYAYWPMDDKIGSSTATDETGSGWDGSLEGGAQFISSGFGLTPSLGGDVPCYDYDQDGYTPDDGDCDDSDPNTYPGADELCDSLDNDCNGKIDDGIDIAPIWYLDDDSDGYGDPNITTDVCPAPAGYVANGDDCDDTDPNINPGADEVCDGVDNDCDGDIDEADAIDADTWYADTDGDLYGDPNTATVSCDPVKGKIRDAGDCDDTDPKINPAATEVCDGVDNDCDGDIDEDDATDASTWYHDDDDDGFGDPADPRIACNQPSDTVANADDCDDTDGDVHPNGTEVCDGVDNDCDGLVDDADSDVSKGSSTTWHNDGDGDGYGDPGVSIDACNQPKGYVLDDTDCDDADKAINPGADEVCDGADNDCDGVIDEDAIDATEYWRDFDGDGYGNEGSSSQLSCNKVSGYVPNDADCDDTDKGINPDADEVCDLVDNDCDGLVDEADAIDATTWYPDEDADGYGAEEAGIQSCEPLSDLIDVGGDCDDENPDINPDGLEICDGLDNDCNGLIDDEDPKVDPKGFVDQYADSDGDGFGDATLVEGGCDLLEGYVFDDTDCDDTNADVYPGAAEICDGLDNDCDGLVDDDDPDVAPDVTWWQDADDDAFGNPAQPLEQCTQPDGYVDNDQDCDDGNPDIYPDAPELEDGLDNDCDGEPEPAVFTGLYSGGWADCGCAAGPTRPRSAGFWLFGFVALAALRREVR